MGQLKVRFSVEHHNEQSSFTCLDELKQQSYSNLLLARVADFEQRLKRTAADIWLQHKLGATVRSPIEILFGPEEAGPTPSDSTQRA